MKKEDLFNMLNAINKLGNVKGVKFAYALAKNKNKLMTECKIIEEAMEKLPPALEKENKEYQKKRIDLNKKHARKKDDGQPMIISGRYIIEDQDKFDKEYAKLEKEYKKIIDKQQELRETNEKLLKEESEDLKFHHIKLADVPEDITMNQLEVLMEIIDDK